MKPRSHILHSSLAKLGYRLRSAVITSVLHCFIASLTLSTASAASLTELQQMVREMRTAQISPRDNLYERATRLRWIAFQAQLLPAEEQIQLARLMFSPPALRIPNELILRTASTDFGSSWLVRLSDRSPEFRSWLEQRMAADGPMLPPSALDQYSIWITVGLAVRYENALYPSPILDRLMLDYMNHQNTVTLRWSRMDEVPVDRIPRPTDALFARFYRSRSSADRWIFRTAEGERRVIAEFRSPHPADWLQDSDVRGALRWTLPVRDALEFYLAHTEQLPLEWLGYWFRNENDDARQVNLLRGILSRFDGFRLSFWTTVLDATRQRIGPLLRAYFAAQIPTLTPKEHERMQSNWDLANLEFMIECGAGEELLRPITPNDGPLRLDRLWGWAELWRTGRLSATQWNDRLAAQLPLTVARAQEARTRWNANIAQGRQNWRDARWRSWTDEHVLDILNALLSNHAPSVTFDELSYGWVAALVDRGLFELGPEWLLAQTQSRRSRPEQPMSALRRVQLTQQAEAWVDRQGGLRMHPALRANRVQLRFNQLAQMDSDSAPTPDAENLQDRLKRRYVEHMRQWLRIPGFFLEMRPLQAMDAAWRRVGQSDLTHFELTQFTGSSNEILLYRGVRMFIRPVQQTFSPADILNNPRELRDQVLAAAASNFFLRWNSGWQSAYRIAGLQRGPVFDLMLQRGAVVEWEQMSDISGNTQSQTLRLLRDRLGDRFRDRLAAYTLENARVAAPEQSDTQNSGMNEDDAIARFIRQMRGLRNRLRPNRQDQPSQLGGISLFAGDDGERDENTEGGGSLATRAHSDRLIDDLRRRRPRMRYSVNNRSVELLLHSSTQGAELIPPSAWVRARAQRPGLMRIRVRSEELIRPQFGLISVPRPLTRDWSVVDELRLQDAEGHALTLGEDFVYVDLPPTFDSPPVAIVRFLRPTYGGVRVEAYFSRVRGIRSSVSPRLDSSRLAWEGELIRQTGLTRLADEVAAQAASLQPTVQSVVQAGSRAGYYIQHQEELRLVPLPPTLPMDHPYREVAVNQTVDGMFCAQCAVANRAAEKIVNRVGLPDGWQATAMAGELVEGGRVGAVAHLFLLMWRINPVTHSPEVQWNDMTPANLGRGITEIPMLPPENIFRALNRRMQDAVSLLTDGIDSVIARLNPPPPAAELPEIPSFRFDYSNHRTFQLEPINSVAEAPLGPSRQDILQTHRAAIQAEMRAFFHSSRRPIEIAEARIPAYRRAGETTSALIRMILELDAHPERWEAHLRELRSNMQYRGIFTAWPTSISDFRRQVSLWLERIQADPEQFGASPAVEDAWTEMGRYLEVSCVVEQVRAQTTAHPTQAF